MIRMHVKHYGLSRVTAGIIGIVFIGAGIIKGVDIELFIQQIRNYGIIDHRILLALLAWSLIVIEFTLGASLMVYYKPRTMLTITGFLLVLFIFITARAWVYGITEDCGCFGALLKRTPKTAIIEDIVLLGGVILARMTHHQRDSVPKNRLKLLIPMLACLAGLVLPITTGFSLIGSNHTSVETKSIDFQRIQVHGIDPIDLSKGTYLVVVMSTDCHHCREAVPILNFLSEDNHLFKILALCINSDEDRSRFISEFKPAYSIGRIRQDDFRRLVGDTGIPKFILIHDNSIRKVWDVNIPDWDSIISALPSYLK